MFGDVIVPVDGSAESARALAPAAVVAAALDSKLVVCAFTSETNHHDMIDAVSIQVAELEGVEVEQRVEQADGEPSKLIGTMVEAAPASLVCMSTHGRGRSAGLAGSVATEVLQELAGPVLLIGPECDVDSFDPTGLFLVSLDESTYSRAILPIAESWAIVFGSELEIVTVIDPADAAQMQRVVGGPVGGETAIETSVIHGDAAKAQEAVGRPVSYEVAHGSHPDDEILQRARTRGAALIGMATHGETGLSRFVFGSITANVVREANVPVMAIRPPELP